VVVVVVAVVVMTTMMNSLESTNFFGVLCAGTFFIKYKT